MISSFKTIKTALKYAKFTDADVETAVVALINDLDSDLTQAGYEQADSCDKCEKELNDAMSEADDRKEDLDRAADAAEGATNDDEDES